MKEKLITIEQENLIECDNINCDYIIPNNFDITPDLVEFIDKPCPKCGHNLLTKTDYDNFNILLKYINFINKWFSWILYLIPKRFRKTKSCFGGAKNGKIEIYETKN